MLDLKLFQSKIYKIETINELISQGVTEPLKCSFYLDKELRDVVVKYPKNRFGTIVLVREIIGSIIGDLIGVPSPEYGCCRLEEQTILSSGFCDEYFGGLSKENAGLSFYTLLYANATPIQREWLKGINTKRLAVIVLYDFILNNCDRHEGNILRVSEKNAKEEIICIDNSHIITDKNDTKPILENYLRNEKIESLEFYNRDMELYQIMLKDISRDDFLELVSDVKLKLSDDVLNEVFNMIPEDWMKAVGQSVVNTLKQIISCKVRALPDVSKALMEECHG